MVAEIIEQKKDEIVALCRKHRIRALWLFGSATTDEWDPDRSDVDFLVDLGEYDGTAVDRYLGLADDLESLLGRAVDVVTVVGLREKPRFKANVEATRVRLYGSDDDRAVA